MTKPRSRRSHIYTKLIRLDIYLDGPASVLFIVRSLRLPKGLPDSKVEVSHLIDLSLPTKYHSIYREDNMINELMLTYITIALLLFLYFGNTTLL